MPTTEPELRAMTLEEMEADVGEHLKRYRIDTLQLDQETLAARAGISVRTLRNIELGSGSSLRTFLMVLRAMGRYAWLLTVAPETYIPPEPTKPIKRRQRVHSIPNRKSGHPKLDT